MKSMARILDTAIIYTAADGGGTEETYEVR